MEIQSVLKCYVLHYRGLGESSADYTAPVRAQDGAQAEPKSSVGGPTSFGTAPVGQG